MESDRFSVNQVAKEIRGRLDISQEKLAVRIGTTQDLLSKVESNRGILSTELALKLASEATPEEASILLSISSQRRNSIPRMVRGATAILRAFSKWEQTPTEAKQLLEDFLPRWNNWLDNYR